MNLITDQTGSYATLEFQAFLTETFKMEHFKPISLRKKTWKIHI